MIALGQVAAVQTAKFDPSVIWYGGSLAVALLVFALTIELLRRYFRSDRNDRLSASDQLAQYRTLYEQGTISEEEFNRLRAVLSDEIRGFARKPAPATNATPASPPDTAAHDSERPPSPPETGIKPA
jgi:hypothetical protein